MPCVFIRLSNCNLRCSYCDSSYTWEEPGQEMTFEQIHNWLDRFPDVMVELTGGEPLLQEGVYPFIDTLLDRGRKVLLETNGSLSIEKVPYEVSVILDIKCPGSGMDNKNNWKNIDLLRTRKNNNSRDEVKFVLSSEQDFYWARNITEKYKLASLIPVLFSPVEYLFAPVTLAELIMENRTPVKIQIQLHRILWPEAGRGV